MVLALYFVQALHQIEVLDTVMMHQTGKQTGMLYRGRNAVLEKMVVAAGTRHMASDISGVQDAVLAEVTEAKAWKFSRH